MHGPASFIREHHARVLAALDAADRSVRVHEGDAGKLPFPDASAHLVVTSPPYPMIEMWDAQLESLTGRRVTEPGFFDACHEVLARVWAECHRVLVPGGMMVVNVGDATRKVPGGAFRCWPNHVAITERAERLGFQHLVPVLWKKPTNKPNAFLGSGFVPPNGYVTLDCEFILVFRKGAPRKLPPNDPLRYASAMSKADRDRWFTQVWDDVRGARQDDGLAAFPDEIPSRLVRMFSCLGETVLDPFAGSGTTLRVARDLGRRAWGAEVNPALWPTLRTLAEEPVPAAAEVLERLSGSDAD